MNGTLEKICEETLYIKALSLNVGETVLVNDEMYFVVEDCRIEKLPHFNNRKERRAFYAQLRNKKK